MEQSVLYCIALKMKSGHEFDRRLNQELINRVLRQPNPLLLSKEFSSRAGKMIFHPHPLKHTHTHTHNLAHNIQQQQQIGTQAALLQRISSGLIISWQWEWQPPAQICVLKVTLWTCSFWAGESIPNFCIIPTPLPPLPQPARKKKRKEKSTAGLLHKFYSQ